MDIDAAMCNTSPSGAFIGVVTETENTWPCSSLDFFSYLMYHRQVSITIISNYQVIGWWRTSNFVARKVLGGMLSESRIVHPRLTITTIILRPMLGVEENRAEKRKKKKASQENK